MDRIFPPRGGVPLSPLAPALPPGMKSNTPKTALVMECLSRKDEAGLAQALARDGRGKLDLSGQALAPEQLEMLFKVMARNPGVSSLKLAELRSGIERADMGHLADMLKTNPGLVELDLSGNRMNDMTLGKLLIALCKHNTVHLQKLILDDNPVQDQSMPYLANLLKKAGSLTELSLNRTAITNDGAAKLSRGVRESALRSLSVMETKLTQQGELLICDAKSALDAKNRAASPMAPAGGPVMSLAFGKLSDRLPGIDPHNGFMLIDGHGLRIEDVELADALLCNRQLRASEMHELVSLCIQQGQDGLCAGLLDSWHCKGWHTGELDFSGKPLKRAHLGVLAQALGKCLSGGAYRLDLSAIVPPFQVRDVPVVQALLHTGRITDLNLANNQIDSSCVWALLAAIYEKDIRLQNLNLQDNKIRQWILTAVRPWGEMKIDFRGNRMGLNCADYIQKRELESLVQVDKEKYFRAVRCGAASSGHLPSVPLGIADVNFRTKGILAFDEICVGSLPVVQNEADLVLRCLELGKASRLSWLILEGGLLWLDFAKGRPLSPTNVEALIQWLDGVLVIDENDMRTLGLTRKNIEEEHEDALARIITICLNFSDPVWSDKKLSIKFFNALAKQPHITLHLISPDVSSLKMLARRHPPLKNLIISLDREATRNRDEFAAAIVGLLKNNESLEKLSVPYFEWRTRQATQILTAAQDSQTLQQLDLSGIDLENDAPSKKSRNALEAKAFRAAWEKTRIRLQNNRAEERIRSSALLNEDSPTTSGESSSMQ